MPQLQGKALELYQQAYGKDHYLRYNDSGSTTHGGLSPQACGYDDDDDIDRTKIPAFRHRPEHDIESIDWSMVVVLLRVCPATKREYFAPTANEQVWDWLNSHEIKENVPASAWDKRHPIVEGNLEFWEDLFFPEMRDVARLMFEISKHVRSEYALWEWKDGAYLEDHLHEAIQRLIFRYLYDHRHESDCIPLLVTELRPMEGKDPVKAAADRAVAQDPLLNASTRDSEDEDVKSEDEEEEEEDYSSDEPEDDSDSFEEEDASAAASISDVPEHIEVSSPPLATVATGSKRKAPTSSSRVATKASKASSSSKRRRGASGAVVSAIDGDGDDDDDT